jgi:hypothetical protein
MSEAIKTGPIFIIALVSFVVLAWFITEFYFNVKIGRELCKYLGTSLTQTTSAFGLNTMVNSMATDALCNTIPI